MNVMSVRPFKHRCGQNLLFKHRCGQNVRPPRRIQWLRVPWLRAWLRVRWLRGGGQQKNPRPCNLVTLLVLVCGVWVTCFSIVGIDKTLFQTCNLVTCFGLWGVGSLVSPSSALTKLYSKLLLLVWSSVGGYHLRNLLGRSVGLSVRAHIRTKLKKVFCGQN